jgi:hypothetical protein
MTLVLLPTKGAKSLSWAENLNFSPKTLNKLIKFSAHPFIGDGTFKSKNTL